MKQDIMLNDRRHLHSRYVPLNWTQTHCLNSIASLPLSKGDTEVAASA